MHTSLKLALCLLLASTALAGCSPGGGESGIAPTDILAAAGEPGRETVSGDFLASHFAQSEYDWARAQTYLDRVLAQDPHNPDLLKRSMVLAVGSGNMDGAVGRAREIVKSEPGNGLALLVISVGALSHGDMKAAESTIEAMPEGDLTAFVKPLILGWIHAGEGRLDASAFNDTSIHVYHAACMAIMLHQPEKAKAYARRMVESGGLGVYDAERAGDLLAALGERDDALSIWQGLMAQSARNPDLARKIAALRNNDAALDGMLLPLRIKTPAQGAALAMYDMALVLFQEYSDTSAKIFTQMALALDPTLIEARILLGDTLARNGRYDEAISYFKSIPRDNPSYIAYQHHAAELLSESGRPEEARALLNRLFTEDNDTEALIRIGDMYREEERYGNALKVYNQAAEHIGGKIPEEYWYLLYARGMAYEREGDWTKAESDLKAALVYRPDNPYLMNYLGYGWADQGVNLDQSLALIQRAVALRPTDGYITDSLGWVLYMMGRYDEAVPHLERAVELLPYDPTINDHLGDGYWRVGRRLEARFQWERARSNAGPDDDRLKRDIDRKLASGLEPSERIKAASIAPDSSHGPAVPPEPVSP